MKVSRTRYLTLVAIFSAISFGLMYLDFAIPMLIPSFVKMDFSELPALIASFALGPTAGVIVCLIKNLIHLTVTTTSGVGELANFLIGAALVFPAGMIYKYHHNKKYAIIACFAGAIIMGLASYPINLWVTYPFYYNFMPKEVILNMYKDLLPWVDSIELSLLIFNLPFTAFKGLAVAIITVLVYKPLSPIIHGYGRFAIGKEKKVAAPEEIKDQPTEAPVEPTKDTPKVDDVNAGDSL